MWERVIEFTFRFVIDLVKGLYPIETIIHVIVLAFAAAILEIIVLRIYGPFKHRYEWVKEALLSAAAAFVLIGFNVFLFSCLHRAFPGAGYPPPEQAAALAELSLFTTWAILISSVVVQLMVGRQVKLSLNLFWLSYTAGCMVVCIIVVGELLSFRLEQDWAYLSIGLIAALLTLLLYSLQELQNHKDTEDAVAR